MRLDHVSFAAGPDGLASTAQRIGGLLGTEFVDGGVHPRFGTRNMILPLAGDTYMEIVEVLDHPASDKAPFGQAVRARSALGGGWMGWVVSVDDIAPIECRLGREAVKGNRHRPDGTELVWQQIGVNGLLSDPQLPFFIQWQSPAEMHPSNGADRRLLARLPRDRRRPAAGQRVARRDRRGAARGREGRVGRPQRHPRHRRGADPDPARPRPHLDPGEAPPLTEHLAHPRALRAREPRRRPARSDPCRHAGLGDWSGRTVPRRRLRHRLPPAPVGRAAAQVVGVEPHPPLVSLAKRRTKRLAQRHRAQGDGRGAAPRPTRPSTWCTPAGPTSSAPAPSRGCASSTGSYAVAAPRS